MTQPVRPGTGPRPGQADRLIEPSGLEHVAPSTRSRSYGSVAQRERLLWIGRFLIRVAVRLVVALGLALLVFVFLEAWLPSVVVEVLGSLLSD